MSLKFNCQSSRWMRVTVWPFCTSITLKYLLFLLYYCKYFWFRLPSLSLGKWQWLSVFLVNYDSLLLQFDTTNSFVFQIYVPVTLISISLMESFNFLFLFFSLTQNTSVIYRFIQFWKLNLDSLILHYGLLCFCLLMPGM